MEHGALKVLVIEDDAAEARSLLRLLARSLPAGSSCISAGTLKDGLALLASHELDAVLLDLGLPDSQGLETLEKVHQFALHVAVIVLTGRDDEPLVLRAMEYGIQEYLVKGEITAAGLVRNVRHGVERKRSEIALQRVVQEKSQLAAAVDNATAGMLIVDAREPDWPIIFTNPAFTEITGYEHDEVRGRNCRFLQGPLTNRETVAELRTALHALRPFRGELLNYRKDGTPFWNEVAVSPVFDDADRLTNFVGFVHDITARKIAEDALRESEERFRILVESARDFAIIAFALDGRVTTWNSGAEKIFGYTASEIVGISGDVIFTPEDRANRQPQLERETAVRDGRAEDERWHLRRDGSRFWGSGVMVPLHEDGGEAPHGFLKILRDLTQTHLAQEERVRLLAAERAAREEAQIANAAKDRFLAVLSHELRTPLTPVLIAVRMLTRRHRDLPESVKVALDMISRNVQIEAHFIDDLLDITRITRGKLEIEQNPIDLHRVARQAVEITASDFEAKQQRLAVALDAPEHELLGDANRLQQVFWNLLKNASKFTPQGGTIQLRSHNSQPGCVLVEVTDSGIGMSADSLERIFNPFEQAGPAIAREFGGLGLGLAIAKATIDAHGGELRASSDGAGLGATFTVALPLENPAGAR